MTVTTYYCMDGEILAQETGGVVPHLIPDTMGNVIETRDEAWNKTSETTYWPYGEVRTQTGSNPTPWGFVGTLGYYIDGVEEYYTRNRLLSSQQCRWISRDPLWPMQSSYAYVDLAPSSGVDPSGLGPSQKERQRKRKAAPLPHFDPGFWNRPGVVDRNNCYTYACNRPNVPTPDGYLNPGFLSGYPFNNQPGGPGSDFSCANLIANAKRDKMISDIPPGGCQSGSHKVCLFVTVGNSSNHGSDYHWYRQDDDGTWSDKPGGTPIQRCYRYTHQPVSDPSKDARESGYPRKCGCFCSPNSYS